MSRALVVRSRGRDGIVRCRILRSIVASLLREDLGQESYDLGIYLVDDLEITKLNRDYLNHEGATDVITFDYSDATTRGVLAGEITICVAQAHLQARQFRSTWQREVVRYAAHGILHLLGFDDHSTPARRRMKRAEDRLVRRLNERFDFDSLARSRKSL